MLVGCAASLVSTSPVHAEGYLETGATAATQFQGSTCAASGGICDSHSARGLGMRLGFGLAKSLTADATIQLGAESSLVIAPGNKALAGSALAKIGLEHRSAIVLGVGAGAGVLWIRDPSVDEASHYHGGRASLGVGGHASIGIPFSGGGTLSLRADLLISQLIGASLGPSLTIPW